MPISPCFFAFWMPKRWKYLFPQLVLLLAFAQAGRSQVFPDTSGGRFLIQVFDSVSVTRDLVYASSINFQGQNQLLKLDVFQPFGDTAAQRPLLVLVHGGSFLQGAKTDMEPTCRSFARRGYTTATLQYRLGYSSFTPAGAAQTVIRATQDLKNAIRFLRKSIGTGNPYHIHPDLVFAGGVSAGGITCLTAAYMDQLAEALSLPGQTLPSQDSLDDGQEIPGFDWKFKAVVNIAGGMADTSWMQAGNIPVVSFHGTADAVVPYVSGSFGGAFSMLGSFSVHQRAVGLGNRSELRPFPGAGHDYSVGNPSAADTTENRVARFLFPLITGTPVEAVSLNSPDAFQFTIRREDHHALLRFNAPVLKWEAFDLQGRILWNGGEGAEEIRLPQGRTTFGLRVWDRFGIPHFVRLFRL
jgi:acetyl esterase/lipase